MNAKHRKFLATTISEYPDFKTAKNGLWSNQLSYSSAKHCVPTSMPLIPFLIFHIYNTCSGYLAIVTLLSRTCIQPVPITRGQLSNRKNLHQCPLVPIWPRRGSGDFILCMSNSAIPLQTSELSVRKPHHLVKPKPSHASSQLWNASLHRCL